MCSKAIRNAKQPHFVEFMFSFLGRQTCREWSSGGEWRDGREFSTIYLVEGLTCVWQGVKGWLTEKSTWTERMCKLLQRIPVLIISSASFASVDICLSEVESIHDKRMKENKIFKFIMFHASALHLLLLCITTMTWMYMQNEEKCSWIFCSIVNFTWIISAYKCSWVELSWAQQQVVMSM